MSTTFKGAEMIDQGSIKKTELRLILTAEAAAAYDAMVKRLKEFMPTIKLHPSQLVSFLITDFLATYFEKDRDIIIAEFFDSDGYFEAARKRARGLPDYEDRMSNALAEAKSIKAKRRRKPMDRGIKTTKLNESESA